MQGDSGKECEGITLCYFGLTTLSQTSIKHTVTISFPSQNEEISPKQ